MTAELAATHRLASTPSRRACGIKANLEHVVIGSPTDQWAKWHIGWREASGCLCTPSNSPDIHHPEFFFPSPCVTRRRVCHAHGERRQRPAALDRRPAATKCDQSGFPSFVQLYNEASAIEFVFTSTEAFVRAHKYTPNVWLLRQEIQNADRMRRLRNLVVKRNIYINKRLDSLSEKEKNAMDALTTSGGVFVISRDFHKRWQVPI